MSYKDTYHPKVKSDIKSLDSPVVKDIWEDFCFEAQQAAEKALKAVLLFKGIKFRFVHDLAELLTLLEQNGKNIKAITVF